MRYHIVDIKGTVYGDFGKKAKAQAALEDILGAEPELKDLELEVISDGTEEEDLAAELREMASLGWEKQEAYDSKEDFIERLGEAGEGFTEEEIFQTWENVWEQMYDEMTGGIPYWFDPDGITLYKKTFDGNEEIWSGSCEAAGTFEGDPDWQEKLDSFFEKELGIKADEWEVG